MKHTHISVSMMMLSLLLCGCGSNNNSTGTVTAPTTTTTTSTSTIWEGKTNEDFEKAKTTYVDNLGVEQPLTMNTIYKNSNAPHLDSLAPEPHVMIVPFGFADDDLQPKQTDAMIDKMKTTFFGTREELDEVGAWESLATYYQKSSYGKSNFSGQVLPSWCVYNGTSKQFMSDSGGNLGPYAAEYAAKWYRTEYAKDDGHHGALGADAHPYDWFDSDKDGFLDLVWIVYSHPTGSIEDWWAYVTYSGNAANKTVPTVKTLGFASIDWMDNGFNGYDPHTFIHETGHTYGLDDYYDYNHAWSPMCGVDMMDQNLGDHNMFSKFTLGWASPLVVDDSAQITLYPSTTTGDCFIIPSPNYNGTAFDEYMMFEFMAPVGLARQDYANGYRGTNGFSKPGIRITHVDARVYKNVLDDKITGANTVKPEQAVDFRLDNTLGGRGYPQSKNAENDYYLNGDTKHYMNLIGVMPSNGEVWNKGGNVDAVGSLFKKNARFELSSGTSWASLMPSESNLWNKAKLNNKKYSEFGIDQSCTFDYKTKVISIEEDPVYGYKAVIQVTKLEK